MAQDRVEFRFNNHSSFSIAYGGAVLLADPWFFGSAFNDGWDLLVKTPAEVCDFSKVTHIWYSHEHPDHFSVPTLRSVPEDRRRAITILFQKTRDKRLVHFCEKLGFKTLELPSGVPTEIAPNFRITSWGWDLLDSFCRIDVGDLRILNLNDCTVSSRRQAEAVAAIAGRPDLLLSQFSYAFWCGNEADTDIRRARAADVLNRVRHQIEALKPRVTVPFASFVFFSHEENFYLNDSVNRPSDVRRALGREYAGSRVQFLYPGEAVDLADVIANPARHDDTATIERYEEAYKALLPVHLNKPVSLADLSAAADAFVARMRGSLGPIPSVMERLGFLVKPLGFRITDHNVTATLSHGEGMVFGTENLPDIAISSSALLFLLKNDFGSNTLHVNGRFRTLNPAAEQALSRFFALRMYLNNGMTNPVVMGKFRIGDLCRVRAPSLYMKFS